MRIVIETEEKWIEIDGERYIFSRKVEPIEGKLYTRGAIAEYEDTTLFLWRTNVFPPILYAHIESEQGARDLPIPGNPHRDFSWANYAVLTDENTLWIAYGEVDSCVRVNKYTISENEIELISSHSFGDKDSRIRGLIQLKSGKLVVAWSQQEAVEGDIDPEYINTGRYSLRVGFAYNTGDWHELGYEALPCTNRSNQGCLCQHPDNSIWYFAAMDSRAGIKVIHLVENGERLNIDWVDFHWIFRDDEEIIPHGELPWLSAVASLSRNAIVLSFQRNKDRINMVPERSNYAQPAFVQANSDGTKEFLFYLDRYTNRTYPFVIGLTNGNIWIAYNLTNFETYATEDLYLGDTYLGVSRVFSNSSKFIVAWSEDENKIRKFPISPYRCSHYSKRVSPTGYTPSIDWRSIERVYDGKTYMKLAATSRASADQWSDWLELTHAPILCDGVWVHTWPDNSLMEEVEVYYNDNWENLFSGHLDEGAKWYFFPIQSGVQEVSLLRFRAKRGYTRYKVSLTEVDFREVLPIG